MCRATLSSTTLRALRASAACAPGCASADTSRLFCHRCLELSSPYLLVILRAKRVELNITAEGQPSLIIEAVRAAAAGRARVVLPRPLAHSSRRVCCASRQGWFLVGGRAEDAVTCRATSPGVRRVLGGAGKGGEGLANHQLT